MPERTKTRKFICTLSIFVGFIAALAAGFLIQVPAWCPWLDMAGQKRMYLAPWVLVNVAVPASMLLVAAAALVGLWKVAALLCAKLRGGRG